MVINAVTLKYMLHLFASSGGDRQGCRKAEFYSLMGEEHSIADSQSDGQSGGKSICFITYYILIYHIVNTSPLTIFPTTAKS